MKSKAVDEKVESQWIAKNFWNEFYFLCVCVTNISTYIILIAWTGLVYESSCMITVKISSLLLLKKVYNSNIWNYIP